MKSVSRIRIVPTILDVTVSRVLSKIVATVLGGRGWGLFFVLSIPASQCRWRRRHQLATKIVIVPTRVQKSTFK